MAVELVSSFYQASVPNFGRQGPIVEIDQLLHLEAEEMGTQMLLEFAEDNNAVLLWTIDGLVMLQLESLQFEKVLGTNIIAYYHSFESVCTAGIGGGHDGADLLHNT
ncbi:hypothetical protein CFC21_086599 [Triticum aestivum]|uniref:Uncharacterized protein n=2 Tax=Triticum aestivum TaxID=4565 RepID=A0A9R1IFL7_WHEAT|nr:hypothetical protein CFC21_086599 [Triticum aestivum]